jgi:CheY-like chemotaxis protein
VERNQAERDLRAAYRDMELRVEERTRALESANENLRQAQKMEAIGALAGGIAHDFNNLLTVIGGCTEMLLSDRTLRDPDRQELEEIRRATKRATALTQQLLAFGRKQVMAPRTIDLNHSVLQMLQMLSRVLPENISLVPDPSAHPAWVRLDPNQIEQVLLNLVLNSRDAMPNGGQIRIAVAHQHQSICLSVSDTGAGMAPEVLARAFEPFFTTKGSQGSGLGLASAHGIVHQSNGEITVDSTEGIGTTVTMRFPAVEQIQSDGSPSAAGRPDKKTVLLVEDEEPVRRVLRMMLERAGLRVIEAASPIEACAVFEEDASRVDILVTDVIMPEMNGPTMAKRFLSLRPDLPVLFISGHSNVSSDLLTPDNPRIAFLPKPVGATQLAVRVRELLALAAAP